MPARRFFVEGARADGEMVAITGSDAHKIAHVLRLRSGDRIEVVDSQARRFDATLTVDDETVRAHLSGGRAREIADTLRFDVAQSLPKGQKMDFVVEKLTELGVRRILPVASERSVVRDPGENKLERWRRLAKTAAAQCGREDIPRIEPPASFEKLVARFSDYDAVLFPWELAAAAPPASVLPALLRGARTVLIAIGPEGGFSHAEAETATNAGASLISLGTRILRTETAALVLAAILLYVVPL